MRGGNNTDADAVLYGLHSRHKDIDRLSDDQPELSELRRRLTSKIRLTNQDLSTLSKTAIDMQARSVGGLKRAPTEILKQLQAQSGLSLELLLGPEALSGGKGQLTLTAKEWQMLLGNLSYSALMHDNDAAADLFDKLSGGREADEWERPWACAWGECDRSGKVAEMVFYNGSGMQGFLCPECAHEQILSDGL